MPIKDKDRKARANYSAKCAQVHFILCPSEQDIKDRLDWAKDNEGRATYIKRLIREDIAREKDRG